MKKKEITIIILLILLLLFLTIGVSVVFKVINNKKDTIPDNYMAVFKGGSGEVTYRTYIYKIDNGHANYGFNYINTTITTVSWGSSETKEKVTKKGSVMWTDDVFPVAKENGAYDYVTVNGRDYDVKTFASMFLMN